MYVSDISRVPIEISREDYVNLIFSIGGEYEHACSTIVASVQLGDYFVSSDCRSIPRIYSEELAYVVTVILAKYNEDYGYMSIGKAVFDTNNKYVIDMEWEIFMLLNHKVNVNNFVTYIYRELYDEDIVAGRRLGIWFRYLCQDICMNKDLMNAKPKTLICGIILLIKFNNLGAFFRYRMERFYKIMEEISRECTLSMSDVIREYIAVKQSGINPSILPLKLDGQINLDPLILIPSFDGFVISEENATRLLEFS